MYKFPNISCTTQKKELGLIEEKIPDCKRQNGREVSGS